MTTALALLQGMCPMCPAMGPWMVVLWIAAIALIIVLIAFIVRQMR